MGRVESVLVHEGGEGYRSGPLFTAPGIAGSGLEGNCTVDDNGQVESITLINSGSGYARDTEVFCPSACDSTTCGVRDISGVGGMASVSVRRTMVAVAGASLPHDAKGNDEGGGSSAAGTVAADEGDKEKLAMMLASKRKSKSASARHISAAASAPAPGPMDNEIPVDIMRDFAEANDLEKDVLEVAISDETQRTIGEYGL